MRSDDCNRLFKRRFLQANTNRTEHQVCDLFTVDERQCRSKVYARLAGETVDGKEPIECDCHPPCYETQYRTTYASIATRECFIKKRFSISAAPYPTSEFAEVKMANYYGQQNLASAMLHNSLTADGEEWMRKNIAKLHVYISSNNIEVLFCKLTERLCFHECSPLSSVPPTHCAALSPTSAVFWVFIWASPSVPPSN